jgi:hypothetical protein
MRGNFGSPFLMENFMWYIIFGFIVILAIVVKWWHDKKVREYHEMVDRARSAGCPMFSDYDR